MSWLKDILEENRKVVDSWPAWKKVRWGMVNFSDREAREIEQALILTRAEIGKLNKALVEKDLQWKRRVGLDCGGHSCFYAIEKTGMRHNGPCSCNPKRTKEDYDRLYAAYQQLMEKAIAIAEFATRHKLFDLPCKFLASPEAKAFLKEREAAK